MRQHLRDLGQHPAHSRCSRCYYRLADQMDGIIAENYRDRVGHWDRGEIIGLNLKTLNLRDL